MSNSRVFLTGIEVASSVGLTLEHTAAAVRAGINVFSDFENHVPLVKNQGVDDEDNRLVAAINELHGGDDYGWTRLLNLIKMPLTTLIQTSGLTRKEMGNGVVWFALPYKDPVIEDMDIEAKFLDKALGNFGLHNTRHVGAVQKGATGTLHLINEAVKKIRQGEIAFAIIASVDSYMLDGRMAHYDETWRIKTVRNPFGFIPGEGANVLLLESEDQAKKGGRQGLLEIISNGFGMETNAITGDKLSSGEGLSEAVQQAFELSHPKEAVAWVVTDLNGETYRGHEWGLLSSRLLNLFENDLVLDHYADCVGDLGAASCGTQLGCIAFAFEKDYAPSDRAMILTSSDNGERAAIMVSKVFAH